MKRALFMIFATCRFILAFAQYGGGGQPGVAHSLNNAGPERLGEGINSAFSELAPLISPDGNTLFFVRRAHPQNYGPDNLDDIWISYRQADGGWSRAVNAGAPVNNNYPNAAAACDIRGETLYLFNNYRQGNNEGIAVSRKQNRLWSRPRQTPIEGFYNRGASVDFHVNLAGDVLLMSLDRDEGFGGADIYVSFRKSGDTWSRPRNIGPDINTGGDEIGVFLAADDQTLYFSSDGLPGLGGHDIFVSRRLDETWTSWSPPENLGPLVNSPFDEQHISLPASGQTAYFARLTADSVYDIFQYSLPEKLQPNPVAFISGKVIDARTRQPANARLHLQSLDSIGVSKSLEVDPDGNFQLIVPFGRHVGVFAEQEGFFSLNESTTVIDGALEETDLDPGAALVSTQPSNAYLQRDFDIKDLNLRLRRLDEELKSLLRQRESHLKKLREETENTLHTVEDSYAGTDPELDALRHRYHNFLRMQNDTLPAAADIGERIEHTIPRQPEPTVEAPDELAEMKKRFRRHYQLGEEVEKDQPAGEYLWEDSPAFEAISRDVQKNLKADLLPEVQTELQTELIDVVVGDLARSLDEKSRAHLKLTEEYLRRQIQSGFPAFEFTAKGITEEESAPEQEWEINLRSDLKTALEDNVRQDLKATLARDIRNALRIEMELQTKKSLEHELQLILETKIQQQIEEEQRAGYQFPGPDIYPDGREGMQPAEQRSYREINTDVVLVPLEEGQIIPLYNIFFNPNTAQLKPVSYAELERVKIFLRKNPDTVVEIGGHTNGYLTHTFAMKLSSERAAAVAGYLVSKGVDPARIQSKGYGKTAPRASNDTLEGRQKNQRIELKILKTRK
jgi:outer membrane protein OmpA-like peptidoglycan-associated protein